MAKDVVTININRALHKRLWNVVQVARPYASLTKTAEHAIEQFVKDAEAKAQESTNG